MAWGADLNLQINDISAIGQSVERYRPHMLKWLLDHNVELETRNSFGNTPLLPFLEDSQNAGPDMLEMLLEKQPQYSITNNFHEGLLHYIARFGGFQYIEIFLRKADLFDLDIERKNTSGVKLWKECYPGMTALELAERRRDHQAERALECGTSLDPDPAAWFAAFTSFIGSIKAAQESKIRNSDNSSAKVSSLKLSDDIDAGVNGSMDPRVPGAYPQE